MKKESKTGFFISLAESDAVCNASEESTIQKGYCQWID